MVQEAMMHRPVRAVAERYPGMSTGGVGLVRGW